MFLDPEVINEIAAELAIDPSFVEKDWYSVQVLKTIATLQNESITTIFSGGTSLSKGHGLLKRFSEDLDFRAKYNFDDASKRNRQVRSTFRKSVLSEVQAISKQTEVGSNYFKFPLAYKRQFDTSAALRAELQIEFSFTQPRLEPVEKTVQSFISQFTGSTPEATILCLSPVETGADKLSALTWRVLKRDRNNKKDDPAMIRHLHDLCALESILNAESKLFIQTAESSFDDDQRTGKRSTERSFSSSMKAALKILKSDGEYEAEYRQFVDAMSYADDDEFIDFKTALSNLEVLIGHFD